MDHSRRLSQHHHHFSLPGLGPALVEPQVVKDVSNVVAMAEVVAVVAHIQAIVITDNLNYPGHGHNVLEEGVPII